MTAAAMFLVALSIAVGTLVYRNEQKLNRAAGKVAVQELFRPLFDLGVATRRVCSEIELATETQKVSNDHFDNLVSLFAGNVEGTANDLRALTRMIDAKMDELTTRVETGPGNVMLKL